MGLKIVCVNADNYLGRGAEYVNILFDSVRRNFPTTIEFDFICFTDDAKGLALGIKTRPLHGGLKGWWNKLYLFKAGLFAPDDRIIYFDLDTVITGPLDEMAKYRGEFAIQRDIYRPDGLMSAVMLWKGDYLSALWTLYENAGFPDIPGGDQAWIERHVSAPDILQELFPRFIVSYKEQARSRIPQGASMVVFHGVPRPHEVKGWVEKIWRVGAGSVLEFVSESNTPEEQLIKNITHALSLDLPWLEEKPAHDGHAVIVGGGPSAHGLLAEIKNRQDQGQKVFALNNSWAWLAKNGITPDAHVMLDARPENAEFVAPSGDRYYASQCDRSVFSRPAILWNHINASYVMGDRPKSELVIAGGGTVGLNAMVIACVLGYRHIHLYGFDSCYDEDRHHAYEQDLNNGERTLHVTAGGREFYTAAWMAEQVNQFTVLVPQLLAHGCTITTHGDGLLQHVAGKMVAKETASI